MRRQTNPQCPNCRRDYGTQKKMFKVPLMLKCGCTYCNSCMYQLSKQRCIAIKCPSCAVLTDIDNAIKMEKQLCCNVYLLGLVRAKELGLHRFGTQNALWGSKLFNEALLAVREDSKEPIGSPCSHLCEECMHCEAQLKCPQCHGRYCTPCSKLVHSSSQALRHHTPVPITQASATIKYCSLHPHQPLLHFCEEEKVMVCVDCADSEWHQGHTLLTVPQAAEQCRRKLEPLLSTAELILNEANKSSKKLSKLFPAWRKKVLRDVEEYSLLMHTLHANLQLREWIMWKAVAEAYDTQLQPCLVDHSFLEEQRTSLSGLVAVVKNCMKDDWNLLDSSNSLLQQLMEANYSPVRLEACNSLNIRVCVEREDAMEWAAQLGSVGHGNQDQPSVRLLTYSGKPHTHFLSRTTATAPPPSTAPPPTTVSPPTTAPPPTTVSLPSTAPPPTTVSLPSTAPPPTTGPPHTIAPPPSTAPPPTTVSPPTTAPPPTTVSLPSTAPPPTTVSLPSTAPPPTTGPPHTIPAQSYNSLTAISHTQLPQHPSLSSLSDSSCRTHSLSSSTSSPCHGSSNSLASPTATPPSQPHSVDVCMVEVCVLHVVDPAHIYVQDQTQSRNYDTLQAQVNKHCHDNHSPMTSDDLRLGLQCAAQYPQDDLWYRVVLREITRDLTSATVYFVDSGRIHLLPVSQLCTLPLSLMVSAPLVSQCCLHKVKPVSKTTEGTTHASWGVATISKLQEELTGGVKMQIFQRSALGVLYVDLFVGPDSLSIRNTLVLARLAAFAHSQSCLLHNDVIPPPLKLAAGDQLKVFITAAQTPWDFYFQEGDAYSHEICVDLEEKLMRAWQHGQLRLVGVPVMGMYACTLFSKDLRVYRVKITDVSATGLLTVLYVDHGNTETTPLDRTYELPQDILCVSQRAIHGCLCDICPPSGGNVWSEDSSDYFHAVAGDGVLMLTVRETPEHVGDQEHMKEGILWISLKVVETGKNVAEAMVAAGKAKSLVALTIGNPVFSTTHLLSEESSFELNSCSSRSHSITPAFSDTALTPVETITSHTYPCNTNTLLTMESEFSSLLHTPHTIPGSSTETPVLSQDSILSSDLNTASVLMFPPVPLPAPVGGTFKCCIVYVESRSLFFIHVEEEEVEKEVVMTQLTSALSQLKVKEGGMMTELIEGQAALASYNGEWHRVAYKGPGATPHSCFVLYVDYGNVDEVDVIVPLPPHLAALPPQALPCSLNTELAHGQLQQISLEMFCQQVTGRTLTAVLEGVSAGGVLMVTLKDLELSY